MHIKRKRSIRNIPTTDLLFGVSRPQSWLDKHLDFVNGYEKVKESIRIDGLKKPLEVQKTDKGYVVEVGNQRLQALLELGIPIAPCFVKGE